jgi:peroxiredoxin (alkyl hydroperoxide reductase subunit C)
MSEISSQLIEYAKIPMLGERAPSFKASSTQGEINFPEQYRGKYIVFFSHPTDFTPVCSSEFILFAQLYAQFQALNSVLVGISSDSLFSHIAWLRTIEEKLEYRGSRHVKIPFPLIADVDRSITKLYGMRMTHTELTPRVTFIIDSQGIIRSFMFYPLYNGRNIEELLRIIKAIQKHELENVATPASWQPGEDVIASVPRTIAEADSRMENKTSNLKCYDWFACYQKDTKINLHEKKTESN